MGRFKSDAEYNYQVELLPDRSMPDGHTGFGFTSHDTEVEVLNKILDAYIDTSSPEEIFKFQNHKLEFSVTFLDSIILILTDKRTIVQSYYDEVEKQLEAVNHRILKPYVDGRVLTKDDKLEIYDEQEKLLVQRRNLKDTIAVLKVNIDNLEKSRNFILGMNQRKYTPKTDKFKNDDRYQLGKVSKQTHVNQASLEPIERECETSVATIVKSDFKAQRKK